MICDRKTADHFFVRQPAAFTPPQCVKLSPIVVNEVSRQIQMSRRAHTISWFLGVAALSVVVWHFRPDGFISSIKTVGLSGAGGWLAATFLARLFFAEVPTRLLRTLGYPINRAQVFSIGWMRTFSNQVVPMTGIAVYIQQIREKSGASWQDLAAASSQQIFIGISGLGVIGLTAVLCNVRVTSGATLPLFLTFALLTAIALAAALGVSWVIRKLPRRLRRRISDASASFDKLASRPKLIISLIVLHSSAILLRGARIWLLFVALGAALEWREALLIVALAEASGLIAITPGGLGIREAIIIGGGALLNVPTEISVAVSLIDRLFVVILTGAMVGPAAWYLYHKPAYRSAQE